MFWSFVLSALKLRRRRLLLAFAALAVAATLATTLFSVYSDIERKMRSQFRGYGANLLIAPSGDAQLVPLSAVGAAERLSATAAPFLYTVGRFRGEPVVVAGVDFERVKPLADYWRVEGARLAGAGECLAGASVAARFQLRLGQSADLAPIPCMVRGIVSTGGPEDAQMMLPLDAVAAATGIRHDASVIQVRADGQQLEQIRAELARILNGAADVRVLHAVAETEAGVVLKIRTSLFLLTALILAITILCVTGNFSALVLERSREIGILKAIGAAEKKIAALLLSESLILALISAVAGYAAGLLVAYWIGQQIFGVHAARTGIGVNLQVFLPVAMVTLAVAALATLGAARRVWRMEPALILRGE